MRQNHKFQNSIAKHRGASATNNMQMRLYYILWLYLFENIGKSYGSQARNWWLSSEIIFTIEELTKKQKLI